MRFLWVMVLMMGALAGRAQEGPADHLWDLYKQGRFEDVVREGKVEITTGTPTAQVQLAVGRSLVDLKRYQQGLVYLETAAMQDPAETWIYAWAKVYIGAAFYNLDRLDEAREAWIEARDCNATRNATRNATLNLLFLGLAEIYEDWETFNSEHFVFHFSPGLTDFDEVDYARRHEAAFETITAWFGGAPAEKIEFFVWTDNAESDAAGMPPLGFARPELNLVHATADQTVGHEMTHVIAVQALEPTVRVGLINEGTAVFHDQTGRDQFARAREALADSTAPDVEVSVAALWEDWSLLPSEVSYPLAGAWVKVLVDQGGREKYLEFFTDQSLTHARQVYGDDLQVWMDEFDAALYD